jgi:hypothetical protein
MTYYCELNNDENIIRTMGGHRIVGRYVIVASQFIPTGLTYSAKNINDGMRWYKHREKANSDLTENECKALTFQILKSETW